MNGMKLARISTSDPLRTLKVSEGELLIPHDRISLAAAPCEPDGQLEVTVEEGDYGLSRFTLWRLYDPAPDIPEFGGPTWIPAETLRLFQTVADAGKAVSATFAWLKA